MGDGREGVARGEVEDGEKGTRRWREIEKQSDIERERERQRGREREREREKGTH